MPGEITPGASNPEDDEWMAAMRRGDFARAWEISDAFLRERMAFGASCCHLPRHLQQVWSGAPLAGQRVLVRCYHGLGDTIQFIRFAAPLRTIAREVIVWTQPELVELVATARGVDRVLPLHDGAADVDYDIDIEIMELPHALRVRSNNVPAEVPYLFAPQATSLPLGRELNVGVVWEAGEWDPRRSIPSRIIRQLGAVSGVRLHSLQRGAAHASAEEITDSDISTDDVAEAAARMQELDLIISVDTMIAHLAGAVGVPVWLLLHARCDWRWMNNDYSVWYPTMRLFRQTVPGEWSSVIQKVCAQLMQNTSINSRLSTSS
jgi:hypothetical protein